LVEIDQLLLPVEFAQLAENGEIGLGGGGSVHQAGQYNNLSTLPYFQVINILAPYYSN